MTAVLYDHKDKRSKLFRKTGKKIFNRTKILLKAFSLASTVYGIYIASANVSPLTMILVIFSAIMLMLSIVVEILVYIVESRKNLFMEALHKDFEFVTKPAQTVKNVFNKITGKETDHTEEPPKSTVKIQSKLDNVLLDFKAKVFRKKQQKRLQKQNSVQAKTKVSDSTQK